MAESIDLPHAVLHVVSPNELGFDQKDDGHGVPTMEDPIKLRFGAWHLPRGKFYIGAIGMDVLRRRSDGTVSREEVGFLKLAVDEMRDGDGDPVPMVEVFLTPRVGQSQDADMQRVLTLSRKGATFHVPTNVGGGSAGLPSVFVSDDGRYLYNVQGDPTPEYPYGRIVQYRRSDMKAVAILRPEALP